MNDVFKLNDIFVAELLEERDLSDGSRGDTFVGVLQLDLLKCDDLGSVFVLGFPNDSIGALADFLLTFKSDITLFRCDHVNIWGYLIYRQLFGFALLGDHIVLECEVHVFLVAILDHSLS